MAKNEGSPTMIKFAYHKTIRGKPVKREDGTLWQDGYKVSLGYRDWETDRKSTRLNSSHRL